MTRQRTNPCHRKHPLERSYFNDSTNRWVCRDCRYISANQWQRGNSPAALAYQNRRRESKAMARSQQGGPPSWKPGMGHCELPQGHPEQQDVQRAMTSKPSPDTMYILALCNGRPGVPACPLKAQCLRWAKDQPFFEGIAGGEMFTLRGPASEAVA